MTSAARKVLDLALALPEREREELARALSDSLLPEPLDLADDWRVEVARRLEALERGDSELVSWEAVDASLRRHSGG
jgi:putative addiction module component (TIGR02574 family)